MSVPLLFWSHPSALLTGSAYPGEGRGRQICPARYVAASTPPLRPPPSRAGAIVPSRNAGAKDHPSPFPVPHVTLHRRRRRESSHSRPKEGRQEREKSPLSPSPAYSLQSPWPDRPSDGHQSRPRSSPLRSPFPSPSCRVGLGKGRRSRRLLLGKRLRDGKGEEPKVERYRLDMFLILRPPSQLGEPVSPASRYLGRNERPPPAVKAE